MCSLNFLTTNISFRRWKTSYLTLINYRII
nr:MAG TPA: hypothetical protein [Crassvirales sp.]